MNAFGFTMLLVLIPLLVEYGLATDSIGFDHFVYTQQWPPGMCKNPVAGQPYCDIPKNVTTWTVHGLWPTLGGTEKPTNCNSSLPFDEHLLDPIIGELLEHWPNLIASSGKYDFWKHEWIKHGTCAVRKEDLNSELKYFRKGLSLQNSIPIQQVLKKRNIVPDDKKPYLVKDVLEALQQAFGNGSIVMECAYTKDPPTQYIKQVEVCVNASTYAPMRCPPRNDSATPEYGPIDTDSDHSAISNDTKLKSSSARNSIEYRLRKLVRFDKIEQMMGSDDKNVDRREDVDKCKGSPIFCECIDTLVYPEFQKL